MGCGACAARPPPHTPFFGVIRSMAEAVTLFFIASTVRTPPNDVKNYHKSRNNPYPNIAQLAYNTLSNKKQEECQDNISQIVCLFHVIFLWLLVIKARKYYV